MVMIIVVRVYGRTKMSDYINIDDLLKQIKIDSKGNEGQYGDEWLFINTIKDIRSADVVSREDYESMERTVNKLNDALLRATQNKTNYFIPSGWIPVSKVMPEDDSWAIWCSDKRLIQVARWKRDCPDHFFPGGDLFPLEDAVAWMPLPEPFHGGVRYGDMDL